MSFSRPLIFGEVLFDCFPDGRKVLGGAPFNVAWNLQGLGHQPVLISAVGNDENGKIVRQKMASWQLSTEGLQVSARWPTGAVRVELDAGQPTFHILAEQAYDEIAPPAFSVTSEHFSLLYLGSLAFRSEKSQQTIKQLISNSPLPRFVDLNIRQPWFDRAWLTHLLADATWIKLNDDELSYLTTLPCNNQQEIQSAVNQMYGRFGGKHYFISCGAAGAYAFPDVGTTSAAIFAAAPKPEPLVDTVGAGDALSAAIIHGISRNQSPNNLLPFATRFASSVCTLRGATTENQEFYSQHEN